MGYRIQPSEVKENRFDIYEVNTGIKQNVRPFTFEQAKEALLHLLIKASDRYDMFHPHELQKPLSSDEEEEEEKE